MRLARRFLLNGRVHGVGFRVFAERTAALEGLHGWVRNTRDGVEIQAEGDAEALERFERAIRHGPPRARVDGVEIVDLGADGKDTGFTIRASTH